MSISQHIAGIRSRTQNRIIASGRVEETVQSTGGDHADESGLNDLARKMVDAEICEALNHRCLHGYNVGQIDLARDVKDELQQVEVLSNLELRWKDINSNLDATLDHLQKCSFEVTEASTACLDALKSSVETTCDKVDGELKAFYHMMTKCDELNTKLSIASSFREEIKTLRKSVETLEQLYKRQQL